MTAVKLACLRCKRKKIKCDKGDPICHQCITAKVECQYVERRQRPRLAQQRVAVTFLNQRLELLEKQISTKRNRLRSATPERSSSVVTSLSKSTPEVLDAIGVGSSPSVAFQVPESAQDSWIYRMANDTKRQFQSRATPMSTPVPIIDNVMTALNDALEDLGKLRIRADLTRLNVNLLVTPDEARQCIDVFIEMTKTLIVPEIFANVLDTGLLRSLPSIIGSPYINVDPGVHVMYYIAVHYGLSQIRGPGHALTQAAYLKTLEHVPMWLDSPIDTDMDGYTAAMMAWVAINNLDYQLSWKFHCKSCHWLKSRGIDNLDVTPAMTVAEEEKRDSVRHLYWLVLSTDCLFRLFYGKPTMLRWTPKQVKPPAVMTKNNLHPTATQVMLVCIWTSSTARTAEIINYIDDTDNEVSIVAQKVGDCCTQLEALVAEWKMDAILMDPATPLPLRCLVADHIMNIHAIIIGLKRLANRIDNTHMVDNMTVRSARKVVSTLLDFEQTDTVNIGQKLDPSRFAFIHFILFYPFCAVFTLYEYIMACTDPDECEADVRLLERVGDAMEHTSTTIRSDLKPFAKTIKALNKVSRAIQDSRRNRRPLTAEGQLVNPSDTQQQMGSFSCNITSSDLSSSVFDAFPDFPVTMDGDPDPLGFVRAMENDFICRNWHENWWDMSGGVDNSMSYMLDSARSTQPQTDYRIPAPDT